MIINAMSHSLSTSRFYVLFVSPRFWCHRLSYAECCHFTFIVSWQILPTLDISTKVAFVDYLYSVSLGAASTRQCWSGTDESYQKRTILIEAVTWNYCLLKALNDSRMRLLKLHHPQDIKLVTYIEHVFVCIIQIALRPSHTGWFGCAVEARHRVKWRPTIETAKDSV